MESALVGRWGFECDGDPRVTSSFKIIKRQNLKLPTAFLRLPKPNLSEMSTVPPPTLPSALRRTLSMCLSLACNLSGSGNHDLIPGEKQWEELVRV